VEILTIESPPSATDLTRLHSRLGGGGDADVFGLVL
jgi:hypothetical protein